MADLNRVLLHGRLAADPDVRHSQEGKVITRFTVAVNGFNENKADFINCVAFEKKGETIGKYFAKGSQIIVDGRIQTGSYTNRDGRTIYTTDIFVNDFDFCGKKEDNPAVTNEPEYNHNDEWLDVADEDGLPF